MRRDTYLPLHALVFMMTPEVSLEKPKAIKSKIRKKQIKKQIKNQTNPSVTSLLLMPYLQVKNHC